MPSIVGIYREIYIIFPFSALTLGFNPFAAKFDNPI